MSALKSDVMGNKAKSVIYLQNIFLRLVMIGQRRKMEPDPLFDYALCSVPSSLIDEHDCLRKWNKSGLVKRLGVLEILPVLADIVIVDVSQLIYHIVWPHGGSPSDLIASIQGRLGHYPDGTEKVVVFDKYKDISAKDHEIMRRAGEVFSNYNLSISSLLPKRDTILKSKNNKRRLASVLHTFDVEEDVTMDSPDDRAYGHDEADITMMVMMRQTSLWYRMSWSLPIMERVWFVWSVMTQMRLSYWCTGCIGLICSVRCRWNDGMVQYWISMPHLRTWGQSVCSALACMPWVGVIQLPIHMARARSVHLTHYCLGTFQVWLMCWLKWAHHWRVSWMAQSPF